MIKNGRCQRCGADLRSALVDDIVEHTVLHLNDQAAAQIHAWAAMGRCLAALVLVNLKSDNPHAEMIMGMLNDANRDIDLAFEAIDTVEEE